MLTCVGLWRRSSRNQRTLNFEETCLLLSVDLTALLVCVGVLLVPVAVMNYADHVTMIVRCAGVRCEECERVRGEERRWVWIGESRMPRSWPEIVNERRGQEISQFLSMKRYPHVTGKEEHAGRECTCVYNTGVAG